jgi:hypothetical protein
MMFAKVVSNAIVAGPTSGLPGSDRLLEAGLPTGAWISPPGGLINGTVQQQESCGWFVVPATAQPTARPDQRVVGPTYAVVSGRPVQQWSLRDETAAETTERLRSANGLTLRDIQAAQALLVANEAYLDWYNLPAIQTLLDLQNPTPANLTSAQLSQAVRRLAPQMERNVKAVNRIVRLLLGQALLDDISDT